MMSLADQFPPDSENYDVWCERCKRVHKHFTMTREQYNKIINDAANRMAEIIDKQAIEYALTQVGRMVSQVEV